MLTYKITFMISAVRADDDFDYYIDIYDNGKLYKSIKLEPKGKLEDLLGLLISA